MVLAVDVGNTNIVIGVFENHALLFESRIATQRDRMADEYAVVFADILHLYGCAHTNFEGAIISSVVPPLHSTIRNAIVRLLNCRVITVSPGIKTGLNIKIDNPAILGSDLVCGAVAAIAKYKPPCIVIDLGTATKISAIDKFGSYLGCSIAPGVGISLDALSSRSAQLPHIEFDTAQVIVGTNSVDSMKSGIIFGTASMMDGMIRKYRSVIGNEATVVATGGYAPAIVPFCENQVVYDGQLILDGLYAIYRKNIG